jgi:hypothetical protein
MPGSGHIAAELRDELLNGEIFYSLKEAQIVIEQWRKHYNTIRPHSSLNYTGRTREVESHYPTEDVEYLKTGEGCHLKANSMSSLFGIDTAIAVSDLTPSRIRESDLTRS